MKRVALFTAMATAILTAPLAQADGFYAGWGVGAGLVKVSYTPVIEKADNPVATSIIGYGGYRFEFGQTSLSFEAEFDYMHHLGARVEDTDPPAGEPTVGEQKRKVYERLNLLHSLTGNVLLGRMITDNQEIYGRIGFGRTEYQISASETTSPEPFSKRSSIGTRQFGFGVKHFFDNQIAVGAEYRYTDNDKFEYPMYGDTEADIHSFRVNAMYHF